MTEEKKPEMTQPPEAPKAEAPKEAPAKTRVFVYDGREFSDPDPKKTIDEVRLYYANFFPELGNAETLPAVARKEKNETVIEFKRRVGTKG